MRDDGADKLRRGDLFPGCFPIIELACRSPMCSIWVGVQ